MIGPSQLKRLLVTRAAAMVFVIALGWLILWLSSGIQEERRVLLLSSFDLEQDLVGAVDQSALRMVLAEREHDLNRIRATVPGLDNIGGLVGGIEEEARRWDVDARVPVIDERIIYDENGDPVEATGPLMEIVLDVRGTGEPDDLLQFLHAVEHLPYLVRVETFSLEVEEERDGPVGPLNLGPGGLPPGGAAEGVRQTGQSEFQGKLVLNVLRADQ